MLVDMEMIYSQYSWLACNMRTIHENTDWVGIYT